MKIIHALSAFILGVLACHTSSADDAASGQAAALGQAKQAAGSPNKHPDAQWFPDAGLGLFIHWGVVSARASGDLSWAMLANKPWRDQTITPNGYYATIRDWKPEKMNYDAMLSAAKAAGFGYAVMVTKHHDGFTLWPSDAGDLGTKSTFGGRDFVREFTVACRKHGLKVGLYYSPPDWWFDREYKNFNYQGKPAFDMDHKPTVLPPWPAGHGKRRAELVRAQVTELLTRYGRIDLIWFDGGRGEIPNDEVRRLQPGIVVNKRNGGRGDYGDSEVTFPARRFNGWFETCATCWPSRKWAYTGEYGFDTAPVALTKLILLRAWGGNLLANLGPMGDGTIPPQALECWGDMGQWMSHSRESVIGTRGGPWPGDSNVPVTTRAGAAYLHFLPALPERYPNTPADETKYVLIKNILPSLPEPVATAVWTNAPRPQRVILLRTGQSIPFSYEDATLKVSLPADLRESNTVEVVKVEILTAPPAAPPWTP
jgi:alpha-L-fucosidase